MVVNDQLTGLSVRFLGEGQLMIENITEILVMKEVASGRKDLRKHGLGERRQPYRKVHGGMRTGVPQQNVPKSLARRPN